MKRGTIILSTLFLITLLLSSFSILAQDTTPTPEDKGTISPEKTKGELRDAKEKAKNAGKNFSVSLNEKITNEIEIPQFLKLIGKVIFGIKEDNIQLNILMISLAIWFFILTIIFRASKLIPMLDEKSTLLQLLFSIIVTLLIAVSGVINFAVQELFTFLSIFELLEKTPALLTALLTIILIVAFIISSYLFKTQIIRKAEINKAEIKGEEAAETVGILKSLGNVIKKK